MNATRNYTGRNGSQTVIGGELRVKAGAKLMLEEGAQIAGLPALTGLPPVKYMQDAGSDISTVAAMRAEHNELLAKLRAAELMAPAPTIAVLTQPADLALTVGAITASAVLNVTFQVSDGSTPTYQWYSNATDSNTGGAAVNGATGASYTIPAEATAGTTYYYCVAAYEGVSAASEAAAVVISAGE